MNFAVLSYNTSVYLSTGFSPYFQTFGCEARLPGDLIFGVFDSFSLQNLQSINGPTDILSTFFKYLFVLHSSFAQSSKNIASFIAVRRIGINSVRFSHEPHFPGEADPFFKPPHANPQENAEAPEEDLVPVVNPELALQRTR